MQTYDVLFRPPFAWFAIELVTRKVIGFGVTRNPMFVWVAQQLRNATPLAQRPDSSSVIGMTSMVATSTEWLEALGLAY